MLLKICKNVIHRPCFIFDVYVEDAHSVVVKNAMFYIFYL